MDTFENASEFVSKRVAELLGLSSSLSPQFWVPGVPPQLRIYWRHFLYCCLDFGKPPHYFFKPQQMCLQPSLGLSGALSWVSVTLPRVSTTTTLCTHHVFRNVPVMFEKYFGDWLCDSLRQHKPISPPLSEMSTVRKVSPDWSIDTLRIVCVCLDIFNHGFTILALLSPPPRPSPNAH